MKDEEFMGHGEETNLPTVLRLPVLTDEEFRVLDGALEIATDATERFIAKLREDGRDTEHAGLHVAVLGRLRDRLKEQVHIAIMDTLVEGISKQLGIEVKPENVHIISPEDLL